jgi:hypothetical protein
MRIAQIFEPISVQKTPVFDVFGAKKRLRFEWKVFAIWSKKSWREVSEARVQWRKYPHSLARSDRTGESWDGVIRALSNLLRLCSRPVANAREGAGPGGRI